MKKNKRVTILILIGIVIFYIINDYIILSRDLAPFFSDCAYNLYKSFMVYSMLDLHRFFDAFFLPHNYPTLFSILSSVFFMIFGLNQKSAVMTNFIFIAVLIFSVYGIGSLLHSRKAGILSAFITMSFPGVFSLSRTYSYDFALIAMVSLSVYCLFKTKNFTQRGFSILLGLVVGLGIAIKPAFIIFFSGPFCYYSIASFRHIHDREVLFNRIRNLITLLIISLSLILFFYIPSFSRKINYQFYATLFDKPMIGFKYFSLENLFFYLKILFGIQILCFYSILFLIGAILFFKNDKKDRFLLFSWFLIPYLFFTFCVQYNHVFRYTAPYLPVIAIIISIFLLDIRKMIIKKILIILTIFLGLFQFFLISYSPEGRFFIDDLNTKFFQISTVTYFTAPAYSIHERPHAYNTDYGVRNVVDYLKESDWINKPDRIIFFNTVNDISRPAVEYLLFQEDVNLLGKKFNYYFLSELSKTEKDSKIYAIKLMKLLEGASFVILPFDYNIQIPELDDFLFKNMTLVKKMRLEPNERLYVFRNLKYNA